jgi:hypothetical protein
LLQVCQFVSFCHFALTTITVSHDVSTNDEHQGTMSSATKLSPAMAPKYLMARKTTLSALTLMSRVLALKMQLGRLGLISIMRPIRAFTLTRMLQ